MLDLIISWPDPNSRPRLELLRPGLLGIILEPIMDFPNATDPLNDDLMDDLTTYFKA